MVVLAANRLRWVRFFSGKYPPRRLHFQPYLHNNADPCDPIGGPCTRNGKAGVIYSRHEEAVNG
jgi:hypothetical protein